MRSPRKAFLVQGTQDRQIIFARGHAEARRIGEKKLVAGRSDQLDFRRMPSLDRYAENEEVPARVLLERFGWAMQCRRCNRPLGRSVATEDEDEKPPTTPVYHENKVFCSEDCRDADDARSSAESRRAAEAERAALERWPGIGIVRIQAAADPATVWFTFPGGKAAAQWQMGEAHASVSRNDVAAWIEFEASL